MPFTPAHNLGARLIKAGLISEMTTRVVIDVDFQAGVVMVYRSEIADERILGVYFSDIDFRVVDEPRGTDEAKT